MPSFLLDKTEYSWNMSEALLKYIQATKSRREDLKFKANAFVKNTFSSSTLQSKAKLGRKLSKDKIKNYRRKSSQLSRPTQLPVVPLSPVKTTGKFFTSKPASPYISSLSPVKLPKQSSKKIIVTRQCIYKKSLGMVQKLYKS